MACRLEVGCEARFSCMDSYSEGGEMRKCYRDDDLALEQL